jgi:hypothetical protein
MNSYLQLAVGNLGHGNVESCIFLCHYVNYNYYVKL